MLDMQTILIVKFIQPTMTIVNKSILDWFLNAHYSSE